MPPAPYEEGSIGQPPLTSPIIAPTNQSFFEGAQHFRMRDFQFNVAVNPPANPEPVDGWKLLLENIAPNALHNSYARYDAPKCDEDTRVEVTSELMDWIGDRDSPQRLLCVTGAAGSGKSALQQTIAERCAKSGVLGSAFFFSSTDPTRNTTSTIVPTISFQLGSRHPGLKQCISGVVAQDPVIFKKTLETQMDNLLVRPLKHLREQAELDLATLPYAILIDGLDECKGEDHQADLLTSIRECLLTNDLPFRIFIASRPEWAIRTALEPSGDLHAVAYHIQLNDKYDATGDMRRYLRRRFEQLSVRTGNPHWFTDGDIETLVRAGSRQFIYVATVYRYISERRASPAERLKIVLTWTPYEGQIARPFEALDKLYTDILLAAKSAYEAVDTHSGRDFLLLLKIHILNVSSGFQNPVEPMGIIITGYLQHLSLAQILGLEAESTQTLFSDLHSLVTVQDTKSSYPYLHVFHKSFSDFLNAKSRAKDLFVPLGRVYAHLAKCCLLHIIQSPDAKISFTTSFFPWVWTRSGSIDDDIIDFTQKGGWHKIDSIHASWKSAYPALIENFGPLTEGLKNRDPEVVAVMSTFFNKWKRDYEDFERQRQGLGERTSQGNVSHSDCDDQGPETDSSDSDSIYEDCMDSNVSDSDEP